MNWLQSMNFLIPYIEVETHLLNRWWEPQIPGREAWIRRYRGAIMIKKRLFLIKFLLHLWKFISTLAETGCTQREEKTKREGVRRRPGQNGVTWKTPSRAAFVPLQEPVAVLASYVRHTQIPVWSNTSVVVHNLYFVQVAIMVKQAVET